MKRDVKPGFHPPPNNTFDRPDTPALRSRGNIGKGVADGWILAVLLTERWLARSERVDALLEQLTPDLAPQERARAQHLFFGAVRWFSRIESALAGLMQHAPRSKVRAVLLVTGFELLEKSADSEAQVVHHAVERAKKVASMAESRLVNAVARKLAGRLAETPADPADRWAHPAWLVERWTALFGSEATAKFMEWNQSPATVHVRWRRPDQPPEFLTPTRWNGFFGVKPGHWEDVRAFAAEGALYVQDPSTRLCVELLAPKPGDTILDACAAPGGKALLIADAIAAGVSSVPGADVTSPKAGRMVALDEAGPRLERLKSNLAHAPSSVEVALMPGDLARVDAKYLESFNLPGSFSGVLLDVPCSNTGVMRHRIDVKWRLREGDFEKHAEQQLDFLRAAARLVRENGRLVYSTCSIDPRENEEVVQRFLSAARGWKLERKIVSYPWIDGHDGAAAFLLVRGSAR